ncbi:MAG: hypothetical protein LT106_18515 [Burkholderiaceae bacterium]|nr:hypothetical protein [Burkholderiaceae bacterium]
MSRETAMLLRGVVLILLFVLGGCATTTPAPAFPGDMRLVCWQGSYYLGSVSAGEVVRLPLSCS